MADTKILPDGINQRYEVLGEVGRGGMGVVYKARERQTNEIVALKVLKPGLPDDNSVNEHFKNELRLARKVTHKNVCRIYDLNFTDEIAYISMEFVEGETLRALLKRVGSLNLQTALRMTDQICAGLAEAHKQGIVYRDLKPENLMVDRGGDIKVLDFGIARSFEENTTVGQFVGSPAYMAPEQIQGTGVDQRTDIYAVGLILYEMLTGYLPSAAIAILVSCYNAYKNRPFLHAKLNQGFPTRSKASFCVVWIRIRAVDSRPWRRSGSISKNFAIRW
jgi:serine/threonine protein kinase